MDLYDSEGNITDDGYDDFNDDNFHEPKNKMIKIIKEEGPEMEYL